MGKTDHTVTDADKAAMILYQTAEKLRHQLKVDVVMFLPDHYIKGFAENLCTFRANSAKPNQLGGYPVFRTDAKQPYIGIGVSL